MTSSAKPAPQSAHSASAPAPVSRGYANYVLFVLVLVYVFNFIDRQILSILAEDIKADLGLTDAQLGFLYGTAFAVFYAIFGIPLGRLADIWVRKSLISVGLSFWSLMTALSGTARGFGSLAAFRIGVGVGESSASPAAFSMLGDYFPPRLRATAVAIYSSGVYIGAGIGIFLGGLIVDGWNDAVPAGDAPFGLVGLAGRVLRGRPARPPDGAVGADAARAGARTERGAGGAARRTRIRSARSSASSPRCCRRSRCGRWPERRRRAWHPAEPRTRRRLRRRRVGSDLDPRLGAAVDRARDRPLRVLLVAAGRRAARPRHLLDDLPLEGDRVRRDRVRLARVRRLRLRLLGAAVLPARPRRERRSRRDRARAVGRARGAVRRLAAAACSPIACAARAPGRGSRSA